MSEEKQRPTANSLHYSPHPYALHVGVRWCGIEEFRSVAVIKKFPGDIRPLLG